MAKLCGFRWFLVSALLTGTAGCQSYKWLEGMDNYRAAEQRAREQNKCLFIFYKWWLDSASNRMLSGEVLSDPKVVALFQDTINLRVDRDFGPEYVEYMAKFGVNSLPASVKQALTERCLTHIDLNSSHPDFRFTFMYALDSIRSDADEGRIDLK